MGHDVGDKLAPEEKRRGVGSVLCRASVAAETPLFIHNQTSEHLFGEKFTTGRCSPRLNETINFQLCLLAVRPSVTSLRAGITHSEARVHKSRGAAGLKEVNNSRRDQRFHAVVNKTSLFPISISH